ncbi:MAG TPA: hypothetical protein VMU17_04080 [Elusimicrobiota bacterium]|nr:hypothetical protein [Elusimicrobiota bacterium]
MFLKKQFPWPAALRRAAKLTAAGAGAWLLLGASPLKLPPAQIKGKAWIDLPAPYNVQSVALNHAITVSWRWHEPENHPIFTDFGFEIRRGDGKAFLVPETTFTDFDLAFGSYSYVVRVRAGSRERGKRVDHVSGWSEPAEAAIQVTCSGPPTVALTVETTQKTYSDIPSLRLHLKGSASVPEGCTLSRVSYQLDNGTGISHSGMLQPDANGRFDSFVDAITPEDEVPEDSASFTVTATAHDEAGPASSDAFTINVQLRDRYAPH